ncbi:MAG: metal ABC transporter permease [Lentisphaeria bacterium]|jgi:zinc transport system permease protein
MLAPWHHLVAQLPFDWAQFEFMRHALLTVLLAAPLFALLGGMVLSQQMAFFSDAVGHSALTGIALGILLGLGDPGWSMAGFAVLLALAVTALRRWSAASTDTVVGLVMAGAVALGLVLLSRGGGFNKYTQYLIGDILTVAPADIARLAGLLLAILGFWAGAFNRLHLASLNRALAQSRGVPVWGLECGFAVLTALAVALTIPWVGLLVVNSLLILPAAAARNVARGTVACHWLAIGFSLAAGVAGLVTSYYTATATGATIVLFAMGLFLLTLPGRRRRT